MNTSKYMPYESVSGIILENIEYQEYPFLSGTGFFVYFPPYEYIFFVTARHCVVDDKDGTPKGNLKIPYSQASESNEVIPFSCYLETSYTDDLNEREDVVVYVVDDIPIAKRDLLMERALRLQHQDDAKIILDNITFSQGKIRTVGFPSSSKSIDYDIKKVTFQPRGFHANLVGPSDFKNWYKIENLSWNDGGLDGFSGSPILALCPTAHDEVLVIPIGIFLTTSNFLSINVATDLIANYILELQKR